MLRLLLLIHDAPPADDSAGALEKHSVVTTATVTDL